MSKSNARRLNSLIESLKLNELDQSVLQKIADAAGVSVEEVESKADEIESSLEDSIDKEENPSLFFGTLTKQLKSAFDLDPEKSVDEL